MRRLLVVAAAVVVVVVVVRRMGLSLRCGQVGRWRESVGATGVSLMV